jgi:hypothetical protein
MAVALRDDISLSNIETQIFDYISSADEGRVYGPGSRKVVAYYDRIQERFGLSSEQTSLAINKLINADLIEMVSAPNNLPFVSFFTTDIGKEYRRC